LYAPSEVPHLHLVRFTDFGLLRGKTQKQSE